MYVAVEMLPMLSGLEHDVTAVAVSSHLAYCHSELGLCYASDANQLAKVRPSDVEVL